MKKILIIDDDDQLRGALVRRLEEDGFHFEEAASVKEGLELLDANPYLQVIILDLDFPDDNGRVLFDKLKERLGGYRIIVHTGHDELLEADTASDLHVFTYLPKGLGAASSGSPQLPIVEPLKFAIIQAFRDIETEHLRKRLNSQISIQESISTSGMEAEALKQVCQHTLDLIGGYTCHIRLLDLQKGDYELSAYAGPEDIRVMFRDNRKLNALFSGIVAKQGKKRLYQDIQADRGFREFKQERLSESISEEVRTYLETIRSAYIIPIRTGLFDNKDQVDAVFNVSGAEKDFFTPEKIRVVDELVAQVNIAITKKWLQEKRDEIHNDYNNSNEILVELSDKLQRADIKQIYEIVLQRIARIINPEMVSLFLYEESTGMVEKKAEYLGHQIHYNRKEIYAPGECLTGTVFLQGKSLLINDDPTKHRYYSSKKEIDCLEVPSRRIQHYLGVPLKAGKRVIGVIRAVNKKSSYYDTQYPDVAGSESCLLTRGFSRDCNIILGILANYLAVTIKNLQLIRQLDALAHVGQRISANYGLDTEDLLDLIVEETAKVMNTAICMLFLKDPTKTGVELKRCYGIPMISGCRYRFGERSTGWVAKTGIPVRKVREEGYEGKYDPEILQLLKEKYGEETEITSFMVVPIKIGGQSSAEKDKIIGVLKVINKKPAGREFAEQDSNPKKSSQQEFTEQDLNVFQTFASQVSVALAMSDRNNSLFKLVHSVGHEMRNSVLQIGPLAVMATKSLDMLTELSSDSGEEFNELLDEAKDITGTIHKAAEEARDFTEDLLGFADNKFVERALVDLNSLVAGEISRLQDAPPPSVINTREVTVNYHFAEATLPCNVFKTPLEHAVRNIVVNAYQAMEKRPKSTLTIKTYRKVYKRGRKKEIACIEFTDTGKGIEPEDVQEVFDSRFSKGKDGGNGLGLWLVMLSLLRMDGLIKVKSKVDKGTTFTIELPLAKESVER